MKFPRSILLMLFILTTVPVFAQSFVVVDGDTHEVVDSVKYEFYNKRIPIFRGFSSDTAATHIPDLIYDSISFEKPDYKKLGFYKDSLFEVVLFKKIAFNIEEVVVANTKSAILGESNRFVRKRSTALSKELQDGLVFKNSSESIYDINKVVFYVDRIKFRTAYRILFYDCNEAPIESGYQSAGLNNLIYATDTQYLQPGQKNEVQIELKKTVKLYKRPIFVTIELLEYVDEKNNSIIPNEADLSRIKYQLSSMSNYFADMHDYYTGKVSNRLVNINAMIKYDFATKFFKKPHKSALIAPAILLYVKETK